MKEKLEIRKKLSFFCALALLIVSAFGAWPQPQQVEAASFSMEGDAVIRYLNNTTFDMYLWDADPDNVYTATVANSKIAEIINTSVGSGGTYVSFEFWAKKVGTTKITIKEKANGKTKKIGTKTIYIVKPSAKDDYAPSAEYKQEANREAKFLKKKITANYSGVSIEVIGVKSLKLSGKKATITVNLPHKVTAAEMKASGGTTWVTVWNAELDEENTYYRSYMFEVKLKKGLKTATGTFTNTDYSTITKKTKYRVFGFSRKLKGAKAFTVTCK